MQYVYVALGFLGLFGFILLKPRFQVLIALAVMTQGFDLAPALLFGQLIWDYGAVLMFIPAIRVFLSRKNEPVKSAVYINMLKIYIVWMLLSLIWSIVIYGYPVLTSIKVARVMIIGTFVYFILLRLYQVDKYAFQFFMNMMYLITYGLLILATLQFVFKVEIFSGLVTTYGNEKRYLPVFLPISLFYLWNICARLLSSEKVQTHAVVYMILTFFITAMTFTRGIYLSVFLIFLLMMFFLVKGQKLRIHSTMIFVVSFVLLITGVVISGVFDGVINRAMSGISLVTSGAVNQGNKSHDADTFTGRRELVKERFGMTLDKNPFFGYGFIHENDIPDSLRNSLEYGSIINTPEYAEKYAYGHPYVTAFYSADIGWADMITKTGIVGFFIFILFFASMFVNYMKDNRLNKSYYFPRLAYFLQANMMFLLMFNGNPYVGLAVQLPFYLIAGYTYTSQLRNEANTQKLIFEK